MEGDIHGVCPGIDPPRAIAASRSRGSLRMLAAGAATALLVTTSTAQATTITTPATNPFSVGGDAGGNPLPFTIVASGYTPGQLIYVEECDGTPPTAPGWSPTLNCDLGSSPAAARAGAADSPTPGVATFAANDANHAFHPFKGVSPQGLFNCLSSHDPLPNNGLPDFRNCQLRVSSTNALITADQVFLTLQLPDAGSGTTTTTSTIVSSTTSTTIVGGTPFGGDDTGFIPPDKATAKCEDGTDKQVATLVGALIKCNIKDSDDKFKHAGDGSAFDGPGCQSAALGKWDGKVGPLACPSCLNTAGKTALRDLSVQLVNLHDGIVFCDNTSGTPEDVGQPVQDATGFVPADKLVKKCEDGAAKLASSLVGAFIKCHVKAADSGLKAKSYDEEGCEATAKGKYDTGALKLTACPPCLQASGLAALRDLVDTLVDGNNDGAYCAP